MLLADAEKAGVSYPSACISAPVPMVVLRQLREATDLLAERGTGTLLRELKTQSCPLKPGGHVPT